MEYFLALINTYLGYTDATSALFVVLTTLAVFVVIIAVGLLVFGLQNPVRKRLRNISDLEMVQNLSARGIRANDSANDTYMDSLDRYLSPRNEGERQLVGQKLQHAGFHDKNALQNYYAIKTLLTVLLPLITLFVVRFDSTISTNLAMFYTLLAAAVGMFGPNVVLERLLARRQRLIRNGFPDVLDLLVVCVEAGMGLDAALQRVTDSLDVSHPELASELGLATASMRVGVSRSEALNRLVQRTGLKDIKGLVGVLDQSMRFGTSVADTLRVYSEEFRDKRMQEAEEKAAKIGTKLLFPMICNIWPSFFIVAGGPAFLILTDALSSI